MIIALNNNRFLTQQQSSSGRRNQQTMKQDENSNINYSPEDGVNSEDDLPMAAAVKIYSEWANHYLERARCTRLIRDLNTDLCDGVLLADVIFAVAGVRTRDIRLKPRTAAHMIENIKLCLQSLIDLNIDITGIQAQDIRDGNLKTILNLFYNLSRYKQQLKGELNATSSAHIKLAPSSTTKTMSKNIPESKLPSSSTSTLQRRSSDRIPTRSSREEKKSTTPSKKTLGSNLRYATNSLPRGSNTTSRNSSRSTSPCSTLSGSSGIPLPSSSSSSRSVTSSTASKDTKPVSKLQAPSAKKTDSSLPTPRSGSSNLSSRAGSETPSGLSSASSTLSRKSSFQGKKSGITGIAKSTMGSSEALSGNLSDSNSKLPGSQKLKAPKDKLAYKSATVERSNSSMSSKVGNIRSRSSADPPAVNLVSRKEVEEVVSNLRQKRLSSLPAPVVTDENAGSPVDDEKESQSTSKQQQSKLTRPESKLKPAHHIVSPRQASRSASSHLKQPNQSVKNSETQNSGLQSQTQAIGKPTTAKPESAGTSKISKKATGIPSTSGDYSTASLVRRHSAGSSKLAYKSHEKPEEDTENASQSNEAIPNPPPRVSSKLSSVANVPYPEGMKAPNYSEPMTSQSLRENSVGKRENKESANLDSTGIYYTPQGSKTTSNKHSRHKARALYNMVKKREDPSSANKSVEQEPEEKNDSRQHLPEKKDDEDVKYDDKENVSTESQPEPPVKPMPPMMNLVPNSYLQLISRALPKSLGLPRSKVSSDVANESDMNSPAASVGTPLSESSSAPYLDLSGYMSDCGVVGENPATKSSLSSNSLLADQSGYLSEGGGVSVYSGNINPMSRRFGEGLRTVNESFQSRHDITSSELENIPDDDRSSNSSGNISDLAAELAAEDAAEEAMAQQEDLHADTNFARDYLRSRVRAGLYKMMPPSGSKTIYCGFQEVGRSHFIDRSIKPNPIGYSSDVEDSSLQNNDPHQQSRKYSSDVEGDYDLDIASSYSMDILSGKNVSEYYFSDTESLSSRPPLPRHPNHSSTLQYRKSDAGLYASEQQKIFYNNNNHKMFLNPNCTMHNPNAPPIKRPSTEVLSARSRGQSLETYGKIGSSASHDWLTASRSKTGNLVSGLAEPEFDKSQPRSMSIPVIKNPASNFQDQQGGYAASPLLTNVKLPYSVGVKNSYSNSSLSKVDLNDDDVKGSHLSLASVGSCRSVTEEKQMQEIRKLKVELELAQQKVATLSCQLTTNAHVVSTFDNTLAAMTTRLHTMNATTEEKEAEIQQLKTALDKLKTEHAKHSGNSQNVENASNSATIRSADSLNSLNSNSSYSQDRKSVSSKDSKESKEKKSTWLRQSFGKAFKKKSKAGHETDSECFQQDVSAIMDVYGASVAEAEDIVGLKRELEEKNLRLTDVQLEALASAQQLETLKEMMEKMRNEMNTLKSDNERLHRMVGIGVVPGEDSQKVAQMIEGTTALSSLLQATCDETSPESNDLKRKLCLEPGSNAQRFDLLFGFPHEENGVRLPVEVKLSSETSPSPNDSRSVSLGLISVSSSTNWEVLDASVRRLFKEYVTTIDPLSNLGLNADSIHSYTLGEVTRQRDLSTLPEKSPYQCMTDNQLPISITLRGGSSSPSCLDALAFDTLIPKTVLQRYMCLLLEHQRIMLCGPSGTGKTFLANRLAEYLVARANRRSERAITTFSVDHKSSKELRTYLANLSEQIESNCPIDQLPTVIILDNLHHVTSLSEVFNNFLSVKHQRSPFIIGTMNQSNNPANNLQLHHNFRWVLCTNHMEPIKGFLGRYLRRKLSQREVEMKAHQSQIRSIVDWIPLVWQHINRFLENFSSADVTIGPRLFLACPMNEDNCKTWFTDLWNYSLVPYVLEAVREGIQLYGRRGPWEDPAEWIIKTWPWENPLGQDCNSLLRLRPEDVGYDTNIHQQSIIPNSTNVSMPSSSLGMPLPSGNVPVTTQASKRMIEQMMTSNNSSDASDQLMTMLLRLHEVNISN